ncbi:MAG TPA: hypothetical protein DHV62_06760 [Elusimicrobia bacterium]|nr:hypothetical protein [Elusimicrobiota bacterium]
MNPIFLGKVEGNKLNLYSPKEFNKYLLNFANKEVQVVVSIPKKQRSNEENRYYWGVVIKILSEHIGYTDEEIHEALKLKFLKDESREIPILRSTASLTTVEFEEYLEKIRMWAAQELNCIIPEPNEVEL